MYGYSYSIGKNEVKNFLLQKLAPNAKILDVGAGQGTYRDLLGEKFDWEAVEIWHDTAEYLKNKYNVVYEQDIKDFKYIKTYDLVIFGDVIEHLSVPVAKRVIETAKNFSSMVMVAVPYGLKQGPLYGNIAERHVQDDLTEENFNERYPGFEPIYISKNLYGYYFWTTS